jgi:hypothetical protein
MAFGWEYSGARRRSGKSEVCFEEHFMAAPNAAAETILIGVNSGIRAARRGCRKRQETEAQE